MSKFHVTMKLQGFELDIQGSREDAPLLARSVGDQVAALLAPAAAIIQGEIASPRLQTAPAATASHPPTKRASKRPGSKSQTATAAGDAGTALDWNHNIARWGTARQGWVTAKKSMWLLYVLHHEGHEDGLTAAQIANTFNKHFKQAGLIQASKVSRDLGRLKTQAPSPIQEDTTKTPSRWYLTQQGVKDAQALVSEALGQTPATSQSNGTN